MFRHTLSTPVLPPVPVYRFCASGFHGTTHNFHGSGRLRLWLLRHGTACGGICRTGWISELLMNLFTRFPLNAAIAVSLHGLSP